jgi:hypothetical protein
LLIFVSTVSVHLGNLRVKLFPASVDILWFSGWAEQSSTYSEAAYGNSNNKISLFKKEENIY